MSCYLTINLGSHNVVELRDLKNTVTGAIDTGATVSVTLKDSSGSVITGPVSMTHDSAGLYRATLDHDISIVAGTTYTATVDAVGSGGEVRLWSVAVKAQLGR